MALLKAYQGRPWTISAGWASAELPYTGNQLTAYAILPPKSRLRLRSTSLPAAIAVDSLRAALFRLLSRLGYLPSTPVAIRDMEPRRTRRGHVTEAAATRNLYLASPQ